MIIHLGIISHRHGDNFYLGVDEKDLDDQIYDYVKENWEQEMEDEKIPEDEDEAMERYFQVLTEQQNREFLNTEEITVDPTKLQEALNKYVRENPVS
jgi:hypothetical protein